ncbi:MAG: ATP-binding protein [Moorea sp. SIO2B7]|nr:ATP-binding protein [Moorena sp. SIO2B7]
MSQDIINITEVYNAFNPFKPLQPGDNSYVNCSDVRGHENILLEIGTKIKRSKIPTCQLYTGHRGVGKSTELLRLKKNLETKGFFVVYFGATEGDIDEQDAEYADILLACTRHILEQLKDYINDTNTKSLFDWLNCRLTDLQDLKLYEFKGLFNQLEVKEKIAFFAKLTNILKRRPGTRDRIRKQVNLYSNELIDSLNEFMSEAQKELSTTTKKMVVIADNLDRIIPVARSDERNTVDRSDERNSNDEIFIDHGSELTSLDCHVIYTVPISLVYSNRATELNNIYKAPQVLPMIMVRDRENKVYQPGINKLKEIIEKRISSVAPDIDIDIDKDIFYSKDTRLKLCTSTGGHVRELMLLMQTAMDWIDNFPITEQAVNQAINNVRDNTYRSAVDQDEWQKLAQVYLDKSIPNDEEYRSLLFRRCVLEYRYINELGNIVRWHDVHPLIEGTEEFQQAYADAYLKSPLYPTANNVDSTTLEILTEIQKIYEDYREHNNHEKAAETAEKAYEILQDILESVNKQHAPELYARITALAAFWKLNRDIYHARSGV